MKNFLMKILRPLLYTFCGGIIGLEFYYIFACNGVMCSDLVHPVDYILAMSIVGLLLSIILERRKVDICKE